MGAKIGFLAVGMLIISMAMEMEIAAAATHVVGDTMGWRIPSSPSDYANWASRQRFAVGDVLVFNFATGQHDAAQVTKAAFDGCSSTNPTTLITTGPANITLSAAGEQHFICTFGQHCVAGQKLAVNVSASSSPSPSSPAPSPGTTTPPPSSASTPAPSPAPTSPSPLSPPSSGLSPSPSTMTSPPAPAPGGGGAGAPTGSSPPPAGSIPPGPSGSGGPSPNTPPGVIPSPPGSSTTPPAGNGAPARTRSIMSAIFASVAVGIIVY